MSGFDGIDLQTADMAEAFVGQVLTKEALESAVQRMSRTSSCPGHASPAEVEAWAWAFEMARKRRERNRRKRERRATKGKR